ncbi:hypothetical protein A4X13_0g2920 [Tilletia indica]|uniref:Uncharacterized protein n=1 Tax=Tilletia indica TaxID=43049 RepID=A0A177TD36_9BASI|nr:hypothetical protein A4X13_0g2920 [Tilletia indica]
MVDSNKSLSAAEQGAAWRSKHASQLQPNSYAPARTAPTLAAAHEQDAQDANPTTRTADTTAVPSPTDEGERKHGGAHALPDAATAESNASASKPSAAQTTSQDAAIAALHNAEKTPPRIQELPLPKDLKRVIKMSGIDNLALLMENDKYQCACWSMYEFKSELDLATVDDFFRSLAQMYPKYRYVVEFDPSRATKVEKARRKREAEGIAKPTAEEIDRKKRSRTFNKGRRTAYSGTLAAGSHWSPARWRFDEEFDITENIEEVQCPGQGTEKDLNALAGSFLSRHFNYDKPIWEALLVTGLNTSEGAKSALMIKIHHCFSDGQGMIQSYHTALAALEANKPIEEVQSQVDRASKKSQTPGGRSIQPTIGGTISHSWHTVRGLYFRSRKSFTYDSKRTNSGTRVKGRLYGQSEGIAMEDIKLIRTAFSNDKTKLTLNDVACAVLSRALRIAAEREAEQRGKKVKDKRVAIFVPISVRPAGDWSLSNYTTGAIAWFSFHNPDEKSLDELLVQVNREMGRIKRSHLPNIWYNSFDFFCKRRIFMMPNYPVWRGFFEKAYREYHVATNVPGPSKPVRFGGHEAFAYHVLPPSSPGKSTLAIGMISYAGSFSLGVSCDDVPELSRLPSTITAAFQDAAQELINAAKVKLGKA